MADAFQTMMNMQNGQGVANSPSTPGGLLGLVSGLIGVNLGQGANGLLSNMEGLFQKHLSGLGAAFWSKGGAAKGGLLPDLHQQLRDINNNSSPAQSGSGGSSDIGAPSMASALGGQSFSMASVSGGAHVDISAHIAPSAGPSASRGSDLGIG